MKKYFPDETIRAIKHHAERNYPVEVCGFILADDSFYPCANVSKNPLHDFEIPPREYVIAEEQGIRAIIHSHTCYPHASYKDMLYQQNCGIPYGIVNLENGKAKEVFFWGDSLEPQDLVGRSFVHGVYDCYSLIRDYYRSHMGIKLNDYCRERGWWRRGQNLFMNHFRTEGFRFVTDKIILPGDVLLIKMPTSKVTNHCGVYTKDNLFLHHLSLRLSAEEFVNPWLRRTQFILRKKNAS